MLFDVTGGMTAKFERYAEEIQGEFAQINRSLILIRESLQQIAANTAPHKLEHKIVKNEER